MLSILHGGKSPTKTAINLTDRNPEPMPSVGGGGLSMQQFVDVVPKPSALPPAPKIFDCAALESELIRNKSSNDLNLASVKFNEFSAASASVQMREIKSSPNLLQLDEVERESRQLPGMLNLNQTPKGERVPYHHSYSVPAQRTDMMSPNVVMGAQTTLAGKDQQKIALAG